MASVTKATASPPSTALQNRRSDGRPPGQKSNITRVRTGCFTCRKRKKKCDEKRPTCVNCQKTGIICEGYPQQVYWENRAAARRPSEANTNTVQQNDSIQRQVQPLRQEPPREQDLVFVPESQPLMDPFAQPLHPHEYDYMPDANLDFMFDQLEEVSLLSSSDGNGHPNNGPLPGTDSYNILIRTGQQPHLDLMQDTLQRDYIPNELPFLITGVESQLHRRLFCHFTGVLSHVLSPSVRGISPFNSVVIPVALRDPTVMNTFLSLAGSHFMKVQGGDNSNGMNTELDNERHRLHDEAINVQTSRFQGLKNSSSSGAICSNQDQEVMFTTSLLLTMYEISEGSGNDAWRVHLDMAREVITMGSHRMSNAPLTPTSPVTPTSPSSFTAPAPSEGFITTDVNPFLLEFFQFHDSIANVTVSLPTNKPRFASAFDLSKHEPYMIGVKDGLMDFIFRISTLRAQADSSPHKPDGDVICKAVQIWEDLSLWKPRDFLAVERKLMSEYYQWALFIWLFSIVYPDGKSDPTVQAAVKRIANGMCDISPGEGVMSCLLFPLFVIGSAAIELEDKIAIRKQFHRLRAWSSLGNIDLAYRIVEKMWVDYDVGLPGSWDWVKQMENHGMSLLVT